MNESPQGIRTMDDIRQKRGSDFPQKNRDVVRNKEERADFLRAAYDLITSPPRNVTIFERLLYAGSFANRKMMIELMKGKGKQLGLMGIFKKVIAYDNGISEPFALNDGDFMSLLREIQQLCAPETIQKLPVRLPLTDTTAQKIATVVTEGPHLIRRKITSPVILAILDAIPVLPEPVVEETQPVQKIKEDNRHDITQPAQKHILPPRKYFPPRRPFFPAAPRRGERPQNPGRKQLFIPTHVKTSATTSAPEQKTIVPVYVIVIPEFETKEAFLSFLGAKKEWNDCLRLLPTLKDDLACMAYMRQKGFKELLRILSANKEKWRYKNLKEIAQDVTNPKPQEKQKPVEVPVPVSIASTEPLPDFQLSEAHDRLFRQLFALHIAGKYREFLAGFQELQSDESAVKELLEVKKAFQCKDGLSTLAYLSGYTLTSRDIDMYRTHVWHERIYQLPGVKTQIERLLAHENHRSMHVIERMLAEISIQVPHDIRKSWKGFEEQGLRARTLFDVIVQLVKTRKVYQKKDEDKTKKLLLVIHQIAGQVDVTSDDEDIAEE